jgi:hypothetical protein
MRSRRCSATGRRTYRCSNAMDGRNLCVTSVPIGAVEAEATFIRSLPYFGRNLDAVLAEQVTDRHRAQSERNAALAALQAQARKLDTLRERLLADYRRQIEDGRSTAHLALAEVERVDDERERLHGEVRDAEAVLAEHADEPDVDEVRELYARLLAVARSSSTARPPRPSSGPSRGGSSSAWTSGSSVASPSSPARFAS